IVISITWILSLFIRPAFFTSIVFAIIRIVRRSSKLHFRGYYYAIPMRDYDIIAISIVNDKTIRINNFADFSAESLKIVVVATIPQTCVYMVALTGLCGESVGDGGVVGVEEVENCTVPLRLRYSLSWAFSKGRTRRFLYCLYPVDCCSLLRQTRHLFPNVRVRLQSCAISPVSAKRLCKAILRRSVESTSTAAIARCISMSLKEGLLRGLADQHCLTSSPYPSGQLVGIDMAQSETETSGSVPMHLYSKDVFFMKNDRMDYVGLEFLDCLCLTTDNETTPRRARGVVDGAAIASAFRRPGASFTGSAIVKRVTKAPGRHSPHLFVVALATSSGTIVTAVGSPAATSSFCVAGFLLMRKKRVRPIASRTAHGRSRTHNQTKDSNVLCEPTSRENDLNN
ncbi:hypothetical protein DBV15_08139, partial [Temnothorax longispinosus]